MDELSNWYVDTYFVNKSAAISRAVLKAKLKLPKLRLPTTQILEIEFIDLPKGDF